MENSTIYKKIMLPLLLMCLFALNADAQDPTISKAFSPNEIGPGSVSTITFTITNPSGLPVTGLAFTDVLPTVPGDVDIADPSGASTTCINGVVTAPAGDGTITFSGGELGAFQECYVTVNVTASTPGAHTNPSIALTFNEQAGDPPTSSPVDLTVATNRPGFTKSFSPSSVDLGEVSTLTFTIDNTANASQAYNINFIDNLPAGLVVASPANITNSCTDGFYTGGVVTAVSGTSVVSLSNGGGVNSAAVSAGATCTITVEVETTSTGMLENVTGDMTATVGFSPPESSGKATAAIDVTRGDPIHIQKSFLNDPVPPGGTVDLEFNIKNFDRDFSATSISFTDNLDGFISGMTPVLPLPIDPCGAGSMLDFTGGELSLTGGTLGSNGDACTFIVTLNVPAGAAPGIYVNTTSTVLGDLDGNPVVGNDASAPLFVEFAPTFTKTFTNDPVGPGGMVDLEFSITNTDPINSLDDIAFIDNLTNFLGGVYPVSVTLPGNPVCGGTLLMIVPDTDQHALSLTGGSIAAGSNCTFTIQIDIPKGFPGGTYTNTTSSITGTVNGDDVSGAPATDDLEVLFAPRIEKSFSSDVVAPGGSVNMTITISHDEQASGDATALAFSDDLDAFIMGAVVSDPNNLSTDCSGTVSAAVGSSTVSLAGGTLVPGGSCFITVAIDIPAGALNTYTNSISDLTATVAGETVTGNPAEADLLVTDFNYSKEFIGDPALPGETVTLRFVFDNTNGADDVNIFSLSDDIDASLPGLMATLPPTSNSCGLTVNSIAGNGISITGIIPDGSSCTVDVDVPVPASANSGFYNNSTSNLFALVDGNVLILPPASDNLEVDNNLLGITKEFIDDPVEPGDQATLEFIITNLDDTRTVTDITFSDDLDAMLTGAVASSATMNTCGGMASFPASTFSYAGGGPLLPMTSCTIRIVVDVPVAVTGNLFTNTTGEVTGMVVSSPVTGGMATDDLQVRTLKLSKSFDGPVTAGESALLTFTIENLDVSNSADDIDFFDNLDNMLAGTTVNTPIMADVSSCGESAQVFSSGGTFSFIDGSLAPGGSCTFSIKINIPCDAATGIYTNTTSPISANGLQSPPATADLDVTAESEDPVITCPADPLSIEWPVGFNLNSVPPNTPQDPIIDPSLFGVATATDNCGPPAITYQDVLIGPSPGNCPNLWLVERTWTATDINGLMDVCVQTFTFTDTTPPSIDVCPADPAPIEWPVGFNINSVPPNTPQDPSIAPGTYGIPTVSDNCGTPTVTYQDVLTGPTPANCPNLWIVERTWTATDACGLTHTCVQTFTFTDTTPPDITCPPDPAPIEWPSNFNLGTPPPNTPQDPSIAPGVYGTAMATDNCGTPTVTYQDVLIGPTPANCPNLWIVERTWTATDACGLAYTCVQTFTFSDTTPPDISCPPDPAPIEWPSNFDFSPPPPNTPQDPSIPPSLTGTPTVSDNCGTPSVTYQDVLTGPFPSDCLTGLWIVERTWKATDACGLMKTCVQLIPFKDTEAPTFTAPGNTTIEWPENFNLNPVPPGVPQDPRVDPSCLPIEDQFGPPVPNWFLDLPAGQDVMQSTGEVSINVGPVLNCTVPGQNELMLSGPVLVNRGAAIDIALPTAPCPAVINGQNDVIPTEIIQMELTGGGFTLRVGAGNGIGPGAPLPPSTGFIVGQVPSQPTLACSSFDVFFELEILQIGGPPIYLYNQQPLVILDEIDRVPPQAEYVHLFPPGFCVGLFDSPTPGSGTLFASLVEAAHKTVPIPADDNCDPLPEVTFQDVLTGPFLNDCATGLWVLERTWTAIDNCGNQSPPQTQLINFTDTTPPDITCPPTVTINCDDSTDPTVNGTLGFATGVDNCDPSPVASYDDSDDQGTGCAAYSFTITRTWTVTDICNNPSTTCDQIITVVDNTKPTIACPPPITIECDRSTGPINTGYAVGSDNCDPDPAESFNDASTQTADGSCTDQSYTITRTWIATDACANESDPCDQIITVVDTKAPAITCPPAVTVECDESTDPADTGSATAVDNCDTSPTISSTDVSTQTSTGICSDNSYTITRTWKATDNCNNMNTCDQVITVEDTTPPVITCPAAATVECDGDWSVAALGSATATDNCSGAPVISSSDADDQTNDGSCTDHTYTITRTWTATDLCGKMSDCDQIISIVDTKGPVITCPANTTVECDADNSPAATGSATAVDNCDPNPTISSTDVSTQTNNGTCTDHSYTITRTWKAADICGNSNTCDQVITVDDTTPPVVVCQDITVTLNGNGEWTVAPADVFDAANSSDNCSATVTPVSISKNLFSCLDEGENFITLTAEDVCGNQNTCTAKVTVLEFITNIVVTATPETCAGAGNGTITMSATVGGGQLGFSIDGGANYQFSGQFTSLTPGIYNYVFKVFGIPAICEETGTVEVLAGGAPPTWYKDIDNDGYSDYQASIVDCDQPPGYKLLGSLAGPETDCDDNDPLEKPGQVWYPDVDDDGYGADPSAPLTQCLRPAGYKVAAELTELDTDCDDGEAAVNPAATEVCNGIDDDCDGDIDEGLSGFTYVGNVIFTTQAEVDAWSACYSIIDGSLTIQGTDITDLSYLSNIVEITDGLLIQQTGLVNLTGLDNLATIGGIVIIYFNSSLTSLNGLQTLATVGGSFIMYYNFALSDCCAIQALINGGGISGAITIFFNASGCNSIADINNSCPTPFAELDDQAINNQVDISAFGDNTVEVYPNPVSSILNVQFSDMIEGGSIILKDIMGRQVANYDLVDQHHVYQFNINDLINGLYLIEIKVNDGQTFVERIVIEH